MRPRVVHGHEKHSMKWIGFGRMHDAKDTEHQVSTFKLTFFFIIIYVYLLFCWALIRVTLAKLASELALTLTHPTVAVPTPIARNSLTFLDTRLL